MYIKIKREPKKKKRLKHRDIKFQGSKLSFKEFLYLNKIIVTNRAPGSLYKFLLPFLGITSSLSIAIGYLLSLL